MDSRSISPGGISAGALSVFSHGFHAHAHNVANISTDKFKQITPVFVDGPGGWGVHLSALLREGEPLQAGAYSSALEHDEVMPSGTEIATELPSMINMEKSFQANVQAVRAEDEMLGCLLDIVA